MEKLELAIKLTQPPKTETPDELTEYNKNFPKGLAIFNRLCLGDDLTTDEKLKVIVKFLQCLPDQGQDMLDRWRDMIHFIRGKKLEKIIELLVSIIQCEDINSLQRLMTAVTLYNHGFIQICYGCFSSLACDKSLLLEYRMDSCRYLFLSEEHKQTAQDCLLEVIDTDEYDSAFRYRIIAGFISRTGINTMLNMKKLKIAYDEEFVYALQTNFFYNDNNGVIERILSGQHMLQMECVEKDEKDDIGDIILSIANNKELEDNIRADAADVLTRCGNESQRKDSRQIISDIGFNVVDSKKEGTLLERSRTVYNDAENIHGFTDQINRFIEKIIKEADVKIRSYYEVHSEVSTLIRKHITDPKKKFKAYKALNRISVDTATFTSYKVTLAELFVHTWLRIQKYEDEQKEELEKRLIEELVDMGDTCSSGHSGRFVNVLSKYDVTLRISWEDQIKANVAGRMNARMRDCPDLNIRESLAMAQSEFAEEEDKKVYIKFIEDTVPDLKKELFKEFVGENHVTKAQFEKAFELSVTDWI